jgi:hypothetical protein
VLPLDRKRGRPSVFFSGECEAGIELIAAVSPGMEGVDPNWLSEIDSKLEVVAAIDEEEVAGGALSRAVASSPWMLKITPSRANTPILISRTLTISEATEAEYVKGSLADMQNDSGKA